MTRFHTVPAAVAVVLGLAAGAEAGQFKRLQAATALPIGGVIRAISSPQNQNIAMEVDVFEFQTTPVQGTWTCGITENTTGRALTVRMISLIGSVLQTCTTPVNGACTTPAQGLGASFLFQCTVAAPGAGSPVIVGSAYTFALSRVAPFTLEAPGEASPEETGVRPDEGTDLE